MSTHGTLSNNARLMTFRSHFNRFKQDESGSEMVEFALSSIVILAVMFGIMDCSRAVYIDHYLVEAARNGSRYAMVRGGSWNSSCSSYSGSGCTASSTNISDFISSTLQPGISSSNMTVKTTWPGTGAAGSSCSSSTTNSQGCVVNVQVSYAFNFVLPFLPTGGLTMSSSSAATILQ
jgi:Flp pilus assembly protein TadG